MNRSRRPAGATFALVMALSACSPVPPALPAPTPQPASAAPSSAADAGSTEATIAGLRERLAQRPDDATALRDLGLALLQRVRETADPSLYAQAEEALDRAHALATDDPLVLVGVAGLQLGRHDFADALATGEAALDLSPTLASAKAATVDALVELGRYDEATQAAAELLALRVDLASLARVSYLRE